ncbi:MAG: NUDIX hydrolase [Chloroflexi bacterium]|nr:NUDIX hydrolase [Chloroflexota bacterium]
MKSVYATYDYRRQAAPDGYRYCPRCAAPLEGREIGGRARAACPQCGFVRFRNPAPVVAVLVADEGHVVLGERSGEPSAGLWATPSGYVEFDEDLLEAARREVREETGLVVEIEAVVHAESAFMPPAFHFFAVYLLARPVGGALRAGDDITEVAWFPADGALPPLAFDSDRDLIRDYATGRMARLPVAP